MTISVIRDNSNEILSNLCDMLFYEGSVYIVSRQIRRIRALRTFMANMGVANCMSRQVSCIRSNSQQVERRVRCMRFLFTFIFDRLVNVILYPSLLPFLFGLSRVMFRSLFFIVWCLYCWIVTGVVGIKRVCKGGEGGGLLIVCVSFFLVALFKKVCGVCASGGCCVCLCG